MSHEAFGYLCHEYGLNQIGIYDIYNSDEPDIKELPKSLILLMKIRSRQSFMILILIKKKLNLLLIKPKLI